jgi:hypothetical protein
MIPYLCYKRWEVYDKKENIKFFVDDEFKQTIVGVRHSYSDNYGDILLNKYFNKYQDNKNLTLINVLEGGNEYYVLLDYKNRKELESGSDAFKKLIKGIDTKRHNVKIHFVARYNFPGRDKLENDYSKISASYTSEPGFGDVNCYSSYKEFGDLKSRLLSNYICTTISRHIDENLDTITDDERKEFFADKSTNRFYNVDTGRVYEGLTTNTCYRIPVATLYDLLLLENYQLEGDRNHFKFVNKSGHTLEFSNEFVSKDKVPTKEDLMQEEIDKQKILAKATKEKWSEDKTEKKIYEIDDFYKSQIETLEDGEECMPEPYPTYFLYDGIKIEGRTTDSCISTYQLSPLNQKKIGLSESDPTPSYLQLITGSNIDVVTNKELNNKQNK